MKTNNQEVETSFIIKSYSKSELAKMYGWAVKTLAKKIRFHNGNWPKGSLIIPKDVHSIVSLLGPLTSKFEE